MPQTRPLVHSALFVALISCGAFVAIPIGPVPIVLQNLFVLLAGLILGPALGLSTVAVYLIMGLAGLPIFAGGTAGLGKLLGPTGGYLLGYLPAVFLTGLISQKLGRSRMGDLLALVTGTLLVYAAGVPWLKLALGLPWSKALAVGMVPFLAGDSLKIGAALLAAPRIRALIGQLRTA